MTDKPPHSRDGASGMPARQHGFTLLELVVAVSILALIAVFSWRGLDAVLRTRDSLNVAQARLDALQRSFNRIQRDAMIATAVDLASGGRFRLIASNDTAVEYSLDGDSLLRRVVTAGAGSADTGAASRLSGDILALKAEVFRHAAAGPGGALGDSTAAGASGWASPAANPAAQAAPPQSTSTPAAGASASTFGPAASTGLRVTLTLRNGGDVRRIFLVGSTS